MPLDINNGLPKIHIKFITSYINEANFCTHIYSCAGINFGNIRLHQWIITTNPDIVESYIKFDDENPFNPVRLNFALDEENNNLKGKLTSMVT